MKSSGLRKYLKEKLKIGRRTFGAIYQLPSGRRLYLSTRRTIAMFRDAAANHSVAIRQHSAYWAIEDDVILTLRNMKVGYVGVCVKETDDLYLCPFTRFVDEARYMPRAMAFGHPQKFLSIDRFSVRLGDFKL